MRKAASQNNDILSMRCAKREYAFTNVVFNFKSFLFFDFLTLSTFIYHRWLWICFLFSLNVFITLFRLT